MGTARVLVVEDDARLLAASVKVLESAGFEVQGATNGALGLERVITFRPEVVVFDFWMPVADGRELLQGIREVYRERVGLVVTADTPEVEDWCTRVGVTQFVRTPYQDDVIVEAVNRALEEARASSSRTRVASLVPSSRRMAATRAVMLIGEREMVNAVREILRQSEHPMAVATVGEAAALRGALDSLMLDVVAAVGQRGTEPSELSRVLTEASVRGLPLVIDDRQGLGLPVTPRISYVRDPTPLAIADAIRTVAGVTRS